jgi:hypothetical protein
MSKLRQEQQQVQDAVKAVWLKQAQPAGKGEVLVPKTCHRWVED